MSTEKERYVIDCARLVLLGWLGDSIDGGASMREALGRLRIAFESLEPGGLGACAPSKSELKKGAGR